MIVLLAVMSVFAFVVIQLPPGDYLTSYIANLQQQMGQVDESVILSLRQQYGRINLCGSSIFSGWEIC